MNTQTKHTPGPWHVGVNPGQIVYGENGEQIANCRDMLPLDECKANARLIAAATELLELLKEARNRMIGSSPAIISLAKRTDEAIAKAGGRF